MRIVQEMTLVRERLARRKWYVEAERSGIVLVDNHDVMSVIMNIVP